MKTRIVASAMFFLLAGTPLSAQTCAQGTSSEARLFTVPTECPQCDLARRFLYGEGIPFTEYNAMHPDIARRLLDGPAHGAVPALHICGEWFVGFGEITKRQVLDLFPQPT